MSAKEQEQKIQELHLVEADLRKLADYLQNLPIRRRELSARTDRGLTAFHWKIHESKIEAGQILNRAVALGAFESKRGLRKLLASQKLKQDSDYAYSSAFENICLKWIPKQSDGFDFTWKRKQVGEVLAYSMVLRYLADNVFAATEHALGADSP